MMPHGMSGSDNIIKEIHQKTTSKYANDVRQELFRNDTGEALQNASASKSV